MFVLLKVDKAKKHLNCAMKNFITKFTQILDYWHALFVNKNHLHNKDFNTNFTQKFGYWYASL